MHTYANGGGRTMRVVGGSLVEKPDYMTVGELYNYFHTVRRFPMPNNSEWYNLVYELFPYRKMIIPGHNRETIHLDPVECEELYKSYLAALPRDKEANGKYAFGARKNAIRIARGLKPITSWKRGFAIKQPKKRKAAAPTHGFKAREIGSGTFNLPPTEKKQLTGVTINASMSVDKVAVFWAACNGAILGALLFWVALAVANYLF